MSALEFTVLALTFLVYLSIIWGSFRAGITPVPSSRKARQAIMDAAELTPNGNILELGSGWGHLALQLADKYPHRQIIGYEISLFPWLVSIILKQLKSATNLTLRRRNFLSSQLPQASLIVCYLYPKGMKQLAEKLNREDPALKMLISNTFALPGIEPKKIIRLDDIYRSPIYIYRFEEEENSDFKKGDMEIA